MPEVKSLRPFVRLEFAGFDDLMFHFQEDGGVDRRFSHLTDFSCQISEGITANFTLVDYQYKITDKMVSEINRVNKRTQEDGAMKKKEFNRLEVLFQYGWHVGERSENPWKSILENARDESPVYRGLIKSMDLDVSEGIYKYTITVGGVMPFVENTLISDESGTTQETQIKGETAKELLKIIAQRGGLKLGYDKRADELLENSKNTVPLNIRNKSVQQCILEVITRRVQKLKGGKNTEVLRMREGVKKGDPDIFIEAVTREKVPKELRKYTIGIHRENLVVSFAPQFDQMQFRGTRCKITGASVRGTNDHLDPKLGGDASQGYLSNSVLVYSDTDRESDMNPRDVARQMGKQSHYTRTMLSGTLADLTIVGDPGINNFDDRGPGALGATVVLQVYRFPYIEGTFGALSWNSGMVDTIQSGKYIITGVSHSMGSGRPYETTLNLKRIALGKSDIYQYPDLFDRVSKENG